MTHKKISFKNKIVILCILLALIIISIFMTGSILSNTNKSMPNVRETKQLPHHFKQMSKKQIQKVNLTHEFHHYALYSPTFHTLLKHYFIDKNSRFKVDRGNEEHSSNGYSYTAINLYHPMVDGEVNATEHLDYAKSSHLSYYKMIQFPSKQRNIGLDTITDILTNHTLTFKFNTYFTPHKAVKYRLVNSKENNNGQKKLYLKPIKTKLINKNIMKHNLVLTENGKFN